MSIHCLSFRDINNIWIPTWQFLWKKSVDDNPTFFLTVPDWQQKNCLQICLCVCTTGKSAQWHKPTQAYFSALANWFKTDGWFGFKSTKTMASEGNIFRGKGSFKLMPIGTWLLEKTSVSWILLDDTCTAFALPKNLNKWNLAGLPISIFGGFLGWEPKMQLPTSPHFWFISHTLPVMGNVIRQLKTRRQCGLIFCQIHCWLSAQSLNADGINVESHWNGTHRHRYSTLSLL